MDTVEPTLHIYDKLHATETFCGEPNGPETFAKGIVFSDRGELRFYTHGTTTIRKSRVVRLGNQDLFFFASRATPIRLCEECYAIHVLVAA